MSQIHERKHSLGWKGDNKNSGKVFNSLISSILIRCVKIYDNNLVKTAATLLKALMYCNKDLYKLKFKILPIEQLEADDQAAV